MLPILLFALVAAQAAPTAPKPLPGNAALPYPVQARLAGVEGEVAFRVEVDAAGKPMEVRLSEVPRKGVGIEEAFAGALLQWRFSPAMQAGKPVAGGYEARVTLEMTMPDHTARMYKVTTAAAWAAVNRVAAELQLATSRRDADAGLLIGKNAKRSADVAQEELHIFVPMTIQPARVYVGSWRDRAKRREFNAPDANNRFYEALERELRVSGEPIPQTPWRRAVRSLALLSADAPDTECLRRVAAGAGVVAASAVDRKPKLISEVSPVYPQRGGAQSALVKVAGPIGEDGYFAPTRLESGDLEKAPWFSSISLGAASLWRFEPVVVNGCAVSVDATVEMKFEAPSR